MLLQHKTALITGSAKGLGKKAALTLASYGCNVVVNYVKSQTAAQQLVEDLKEQGGSAIAVQADITVRKQLQTLLHRTEEAFGGVDILINNAGPFIRERRTFGDYELDEIHYLIQGNLTSVMELDHMVLRHMRKNRWGRIIHYGFGRAGEARGWPHRAVYAAAKVGLVSFTKTLAVEEAEHGITVNMICPGDIKGNNKEKAISEALHLTDDESPRGRPGTGEDVARVIGFLCLPESDFITGNIMEISGGLDPIRTLPLK